MTLALSLPGGPVIQALGGLRATAFFCAAGVALAATGVQTWRLHHAQDRSEQWAQAFNAAREANQTNRDTINKLRDANADWARLCSFDPKAAEGAASTAAANRDALPADDQRRQEEREKTYVEPSAAAWGRTVVPAAIADRLRR